MQSISINCETNDYLFWFMFLAREFWCVESVDQKIFWHLVEAFGSSCRCWACHTLVGFCRTMEPCIMYQVISQLE